MDYSSRTRRSRLQPLARPSVSALMAFIAIMGLGVGLVVRRASTQREAVEAVKQAGGHPGYDWQVGADGISPPPRSPWRQWIGDRVGTDLVDTVVWVYFISHEGTTVSETVMAHIGRL